MERITTIYSACCKIDGFHFTESIIEETFNSLVSLGCNHTREIVLKGQLIYVHKTIFVDAIIHDSDPIDLDIDHVFEGHRVPSQK